MYIVDDKAVHVARKCSHITQVQSNAAIDRGNGRNVKEIHAIIIGPKILVEKKIIEFELDSFFPFWSINDLFWGF